MPTCRRKRVVLTQPSDELLQSVKTDPAREVFYLRHTGEIFETYEYVLAPLCRPRPTLTSSKGLCCTYVLLQIEAVPVRGHRKKWSRLFSGSRK